MFVCLFVCLLLFVFVFVVVVVVVVESAIFATLGYHLYSGAYLLSVTNRYSLTWS